MNLDKDDLNELVEQTLQNMRKPGFMDRALQDPVFQEQWRRLVRLDNSQQVADEMFEDNIEHDNHQDLQLDEWEHDNQ